MLSLNVIRENPQVVEMAIAAKNVSLDLGALLALDAEVRAMKGELDELRRQRKEISDGFRSAPVSEQANLRQQVKEIADRIGAIESVSDAKTEALQALMLRLPGIPWDGAPVGPDESFNTVVRKEIGRAHGCTPVTNAQPVCRL